MSKECEFCGRDEELVTLQTRDREQEICEDCMDEIEDAIDDLDLYN